MKALKRVLDFLFGADPQIFDDKGKLGHKLPQKVWHDWKARTKEPRYNWRQHAGTKAPHHSKPGAS